MTIPELDETLETIFPRYKVYQVDQPVTLRATAHPGAPSAIEWPETSDWCVASHGPWAADFCGNRNGDFYRCWTRSDKTGESQGSAAWLLLNHAPALHRTACLPASVSTTPRH